MKKTVLSLTVAGGLVCVIALLAWLGRTRPPESSAVHVQCRVKHGECYAVPVVGTEEEGFSLYRFGQRKDGSVVVVEVVRGLPRYGIFRVYSSQEKEGMPTTVGGPKFPVDIPDRVFIPRDAGLERVFFLVGGPEMGQWFLLFVDGFGGKSDVREIDLADRVSLADAPLEDRNLAFLASDAFIARNGLAMDRGSADLRKLFNTL